MLSPRATFDQSLTQLGNRLLRMGSLVDEALDLAIRSLVERDSAIAMRVIQGDATINKLRYTIEEQCYQLLVTQQPMAGDMRRIAAAISIATNMERMADHAAGIAALVRRLNDEPEVREFSDLSQMATLARAMLRRALNAYLNVDAELAREVARDDVQMNQLNERVLHEMLNFMIEQQGVVRRGTYLLWIAHNLERWGDRIKNICERVVYIATGELADFDTHAGTEEVLDEHDVVDVLLESNH